MPFRFTLPTTSFVPLTHYFSSSTHPSLPLAATSSRGVLRDALKKHKRLSAAQQATNLPSILAALNEYLPFLFAIDSGVCGSRVAGEEVDVALIKELEVEWRAVLSATMPGREAQRVKVKSLESELFFTLSTLGYTYCLLARAQLHTLYNATSPTPAQRTAAVAGAMKQLLLANSVFQYLVTRSQQTPPPTSVPDLSQSVLSGLASLTMAEATLISVYKDDPYPAVVADSRNKDNKDWMFKNPEIPKVRAHLFARLSLAATEHAARAQAMLGRSGSSKVDADLVDYCDDLRRTARAKACRFFAIDVELEGKSGEGIAWLRGAKKELGFTSAGEDEKKRFGGLSKLKKDWQERREDRRVEKGGEWGSDAGKFEEGRILDMLERKWVKENDTARISRDILLARTDFEQIMNQIVPPSEPLLANMPSGREIHTSKPYETPSLELEVIARMRAPPDLSELALQGAEEESDDEPAVQTDPVGAFPGTREQYSGSSASYY